MNRLENLLKGRLRHHEPLAKYTAARIGGPADLLYIANAKNLTNELVQVMQIAWDEGIPVRVLGGGANVLVSDSGFRGLVVINRISEVEFGNWHDGRTVSATGGTGLIAMARMCQSRGFSGMEWAVSVPGTVGGGVVNNAGAHGADMSKILGDAVVLEYGKGPQLYNVADMQYNYRSSILKYRDDKRFIVLLATFVLPADEPQIIAERMETYSIFRKRTQPPGASLGSIFKNPPGDYAGRLIEASGLKGYSVGGAQVSSVHANFFINANHATSYDYFNLIQHVRRVVCDKLGVELELEIETLGQWDIPIH